jgi:hypothetical protein
MTIAKRRVAVEPVCSTFLAGVDQVRFEAGQEEAFRTYAGKLSSRTVIRIVERPDMVQLNSRGWLAGLGYQFTPLAFRQLCGRMSPGLFTLAADISGYNRRRGRCDSVVSVPVAAELINKCSALRFAANPGLLNSQLVLDAALRVVEGIVGPKYRYLAHSTLYDTISDALRCEDSRLIFAEASLYGRRLSLTYRYPQAAFTLPTGDTFFRGLYFHNSEAGECGVHIADTVTVRLPDGDVFRAIGRLESIAHSGKRFSSRMRRAVHKSVANHGTTVRLGDMAATLLGTPLEALTPQRTVKKDWRASLIRRMAFRRIDKVAATEVVRWALFAGGHGNRVPKTIEVEAIAQRTAYDVFLSLLRIAAQYPPRIREPMERLAYELLLGKFHC